MMTMRSDPLLQAARRLVSDGAIGEPTVCNARKSYKWGKRPAWFGDSSLYGSTASWVGIHGIDMIHFVTGKKFAEVSAYQANLAHAEFPAAQDAGWIAGRLEGGASATVSFDYFRPQSSGTHGDDWIRVVGTRGVLEVDLQRGEIRLDAESTSIIRLADVAPRAPVFGPAVLDPALRFGDDRLLSTEDSLYLARAALTAALAAKEKRTLPLPGF
jgi:predicted dehydrogenase